MNNEIYNDLFNEKLNEFINNKISEFIKKDTSIIIKNPILEIEYDITGEKKDIYSLASERDIKNMQFLSDINEIEFKYKQNLINEDEHKKMINSILDIQNNQNLLYDDLIFNIINTNDLNSIKDSIKKHKLNDIDLERLAKAINAVSENKINEFKDNNRKFMLDKISYWNYKYNKISKGLSKAREVESFIINLIKEK